MRKETIKFMTLMIIKYLLILNAILIFAGYSINLIKKQEIMRALGEGYYIILTDGRTIAKDTEGRYFLLLTKQEIKDMEDKMILKRRKEE